MGVDNLLKELKKRNATHLIVQEGSSKKTSNSSSDKSNTEKNKKETKKTNSSSSSSSGKGSSVSGLLAELDKRGARNLVRQEDDIAPIKTQKTVDVTSSSKKKEKEEEKDRKWYEKGLFEDGYQFGDVTKTILGIVNDAPLPEGYRDANFADVTWRSLKQGYNNARLGEESFAELFGDENDKAKYEEILSSEEYKFAPSNVIEEGVSGAFNLLGQQVRQFTNPRTLAATGSGALAAAVAGQMGPQIALPEEVISVPAAALAGFTAGNVASSLEIEAGLAYNEMLEAGISKDTARKIAIGVGSVNAALEAFQVDELLDAYKATKATGATKTVTKRLAKELKERGIDVAKETAQEVAQEGVTIAGTQVGSKIDTGEWAYGADEVSERLLDTAKSSALSFGVMNAPAAAKNTVSIAKEQKAASKLTDNEQKVVDKVYNDAIADAEQDGKKLTQREKSKLYDSVLNDLEKGYITTDTIESVLGGETYKSYRDTVDSEDALKKELDELRHMESGKMNDIQRDRLSELKGMNLDDATKRNELRSKLDSEVMGLVNGSRLAESYNERSRRGQAYEADLSKYDAKQQQTIQKAIDSGILNNTNRTHEFVDLVAKISADKGVLFDFTNNEKLKESGFAVGEGATVNGFVTKDGVTVNINSAKSLNSVVGHEITHVLEGTEVYTELQNVLTEYAKTKGEYDSRRSALESLYKGIADADIDAELTADLVGDYLFTDADFVKHLSVENRNIFQKIYDEIKYLCKVVTAGSKEARELEKVRKVFADAYKASGKAQSDSTKYSMTADSNGKQLSSEQQEYFKDSKVRDENGNLKVMYHGTPNGEFAIFRDGTYFTDNKEYADIYQNPGASSISTGKVASNPKTFEVYLDIKKPFDINDAEARRIYIDDYIKGGNAMGIDPYMSDAEYDKITTIDWTEGEDLREFLIENEYDYDGLVLDEGATGGYGDEVKSRGKSYVVFRPEQIKNIDNLNPTADHDIRRSLSAKDNTPKQYGNYNVYGKDVALETAPVKETVQAPVRTVSETESVETETPKQINNEHPIRSVQDRQTAKLHNLNSELANNQRLRNEAKSKYDAKIKELQAEYNGKKNKDTKVANDILRRIERLQRMQGNIDADYAKRIADIEKQISNTDPKWKPKVDPIPLEEVDINNIPGENKVRAKETDEKPKKKGKLWSAFKEHFIDNGMAFEDVSLKTGNREVQSKWNFIRSSEKRAQHFIGKGKPDKGIKALNDIRQSVESKGEKYSTQFEGYIHHLLNIDCMTLSERFPGKDNMAVFGDEVTADVSRKVVALYEEAHPEFADLAKEIYANTTYLRQMLVDSGHLSQEMSDLLAEMYPHYVPIRRAIADMNAPTQKDGKKAIVGTPVKERIGGDQKLEPLFETLALRAESTFKATALNSFGLELKNTLDSSVASEDADVDSVIDGIDNQNAEIVRGGNGVSPKFTIFENGKRVTFDITEEMYEALKPKNEALSGRSKLLSGASSFHRGLLTEYNPAFMITNAIKDAQDVLMNSQHAAKTYAKFPTAIKQMATKGEWFAEYMENGGEDNTYFEGESKSFDTESKGVEKLLGLPPLKWISKANNVIEMLPRLSEYIASRESGASIETAMLDAARVTTNFAAGGDVTKFLNRNGATFLNASVQGAAQQVRNIREAKMNGLKGWAQLAGKFAIAGLVPELLNHLLWEDDEDYEELSDYVKDNYYIVAKYGDGKFVRIPKGRTLAVIQDAFEQVGNAITGDDEVDLKNFLELVVTNLAPNDPLNNNVFAPIKQTLTNETWYGDELVPSRLQDLPAAEQFDETTDSISRWLGEKVNISPYKLNYLLNQYSGGVGDVLLPMLTPKAESADDSFGSKLLAPLRDKFTTDSVLKNQNVTDFYSLQDELAVTANGKDATEEDEIRKVYLDAVGWDMSDLYAQKREIQSSDMSDSEKYEAVRELQEQINALAEEGLNSYNDVFVDGIYAEVGDRRFDYNEEKGLWYEIVPYKSNGEENYYYNLEQNVVNKFDASYSDFWNNMEYYQDAYNFATDYGEDDSILETGLMLFDGETFAQYAYDLSQFKADPDGKGGWIPNSKKEKILDYCIGIDGEKGAGLVLYKKLYPKDKDYNYDIIDYLNSRDDIDYEQMETILTELGMKVDDKGYITW